MAGGEVFVRAWHPRGPRVAVPWVLLHDSLGCIALWRDFPARLAALTGRSVYAYDRLGFGASSPCATEATAHFVDEEACDRLPRLLAQLALEEVLLLGHSVGAGMAITAAAQPSLHDRVRAVITLAAQAFVEDRTRAGIRAADRTFAEPVHFQRLARYHGDKAAWVLRAWVDVWLSEAFAGWSLDAALEALRCPVFAVHGDRDEYGSLAFPRRIVERSGGPKAQLLVLERCAHVPHRERPSALLAAITEFVASAEL